MPPLTRRHLSSGAVVHVWAPSSPRAVVVVQHGYGEYAHRFVTEHGRFVPSLVEAGLEVWALDLWGHGYSPGARGVTSVRLAVRDHLETRRVAAERGLPVLLFGHSLGGLVTAGSVAARPDDVAGVVLSSSALPSEPALLRRALGAASAVAPTMPIPLRRSPVAGLSRDPEVVLRAIADQRMTHRQIPLLLAATAIDVMNDVRQRIAGWSAPTLVLHGSADVYTDPSGSEDLFDSLTVRDKTFRRIEGGVHELLHDVGGHELAEEVVSWLAAHAETDDPTRSADET